MVDIDKLKGTPDVEFNFVTSSDVKSAFRTKATNLEEQRDSRSSWRKTGLDQFDGRFKDIFEQNGTTQLGDLTEVVSALKAVAGAIEDVEEAAREENKRRETAREWAQRQADRNALERGWDNVFGGEDPPNTDTKDSGPAAKTSAPSTRPRETPAPGSSGSGGGGGTSSAKPENLRSFANDTEGGDSSVSGYAKQLETQCENFVRDCSWASLDATGPIQGLRDWLKLNGDDAKWANTVADAFAQAGGEGNVSTLSNSTIEAALRNAGVQVSRTDIVVDPPTAYGSPPTTGYSDDPVNTATGNFIENEADLGFPGSASALALTRTYNSLKRSVGAFGLGWSSWTEAGLTLTDDAARLRLSDGREIVFPRLGDGWGRATGENLWLGRHGSGYLVTGSTGLRWELSAAGRLVAASTGPGTTISYDYDPAGRLVTMTHEFGRTLELHWDPADKIVGATASDGRRVSYEYDERGHLVAADTPAGTRRYRWNDADLIDAVFDADGVLEAENTYDDLGRVTTQRSPFGRLTRFVYLPGGVTEVSDTDGTRANTWIADGKGRLIGVIDADDHRQSTSYDRYGNPVMITDRQGGTVINSYDDRGRLTGRQTPTGAKIAWTHDDHDRPVTITLHNGEVEAVTRYAYDGDERNPSTMIDAEGGVTQMSWDRGLLKEVIDPEGVGLRFDHDNNGELIAATDAEGNTARLERDDLGRVTAAITPLGHKTTYRYRGTGPLQSRQDPDGAIWHYEHSTAGRLTTIIDPTGARTTIEHGDHGEESRTVDPLGRAVTSEYDDLGNRNRVELPDGSVWQYTHDAMSRLVETVDPTGGHWQTGFDANGRLTETVDPTGVQRMVWRDHGGRPIRAGDRLSQTSADYDVFGRMVGETGPDGSTDWYRHDRCGRLIGHTDPMGGVTRIQRDGAGRAVAITHPEGTTFRYEYDTCGRRSATVDTDGSRYGFSYDADGRLTREDWPTGEQAWVRYSPAGRAIERFEPGTGVTKFGYDPAGRILRISDGWNGQRRFRYNAAGQLTSVINAAGGETRFEYDGNGRCIASVDPLGGRRERTFDAMSRVLTETDALGRTTHYTYDAAGRQTKRVDPTGSVLSWRYDNTGRRVDTLVDDVLMSRTERDFASRTMRVHEGGTVNELAWDAQSRLTRRMRGGIGVSWTYDGDGRRTSFTGIHGDQTRYEYDQAGRVSAIEAPELGRAVIDRDAIGRICSMSAPGLYASWTWDGGAVNRLETSRDGKTQITEIERDESGRVVATTTNGMRTGYAYDPTGQLVEDRRSDGSVTAYAYDAAGRLIREVTDGRATRLRYDEAGQLLEKQGPAGSTRYSYDPAGRRITEVGPEGERRFGWDPRGFLESFTTITHSGDKVSARTQQFHVDALGELSTIDGEQVAWDTANAVPTLAQIGEVSITGYGPLTALMPNPSDRSGGEWITPNWRPHSTGETDPWGVAAGSAPTGLPSGVQIGGQGNLLVAGMEWMQARVYDPDSRGFLSTDPRGPVLGTGWTGNPYAFAGNDPLNQSDPWGLRPVTDKELQAYRDSNNGALSDAWDATTTWVSENWEYIAAGALIVGGIAVMATGVGGPIGAAMIGGALLSAGGSAGMQKFQNGEVDWGQVAVDGAIGGVAGLAGGGAGVAAMRSASRAGMNCMGRNVITGAAAGAAEGGVSGGLTYAASGQPLTPGGFAKATLGGMATGGVGGAAAGGALTKISGSACFAAGTQVLMADGSSKSIDDVAVGDEVVAADPDTGKTHTKEVIDTYVHESVETWEVSTSSGSVISTAEHPFYVQGKGWVPVRELLRGDVLVEPDGSEIKVERVAPTGETGTVYNFEVGGLHNYHVRAGESWVRVHNDCTVDLASASRRQHILDGDGPGSGGHLWPGQPGKTPFPESWDGDKIMHEVSDIATDPSLTWNQQTGPAGSDYTRAGDPSRFTVTGNRDGVDVKVVVEPAGEGIITAHPV